MISGTEVVTLTAWRAGILYMKEELKDLQVSDHRRVDNDFDGFGEAAIFSVSGFRYTTGLPDPCIQHIGVAPQQTLHASEATSGENGCFGLSGHGLSFLSGLLGIAIVMSAP